MEEFLALQKVAFRIPMISEQPGLGRFLPCRFRDSFLYLVPIYITQVPAESIDPLTMERPGPLRGMCMAAAPSRRRIQATCFPLMGLASFVLPIIGKRGRRRTQAWT